MARLGAQPARSLVCGPRHLHATLRAAEDKDNFCNAVRSEVKATGMLDTTENCWDFFINKVGCGAGGCWAGA